MNKQEVPGYDVYLIKDKYDSPVTATFSLEHAKQLTKGTRLRIYPCWFKNSSCK